MKKAKITDYTWKTFGADTRLANADESVAENIPMVIKGPKPAIFSIAWNKQNIIQLQIISIKQAKARKVWNSIFKNDDTQKLKKNQSSKKLF